jgi:hypothetical protein
MGNLVTGEIGKPSADEHNSRRELDTHLNSGLYISFEGANPLFATALLVWALLFSTAR